MKRLIIDTFQVKLALVFVAFFLILGRFISLIQGVDPWIDEAMLVRNLPVADKALTTAMPLYDQAGPLGYVWIASKLVEAFPGQILLALRSFSALASLAAAWWLYSALQKLTLERAAPLAIALGFLTFFPLVYAIEIKHYGVEMAATALLCATGAHMALAPSLRSGLLILTAMITAILFSFSAPIVIACVFVGIVALRFRAVVRHPVSEALTIGLPFAVAAVAFLCCYLLYTKPVTAYQFEAYRLLYQADTASFDIRSAEDLKTWLRFPLLLLRPYTPAAWGTVPTVIAFILLCIALPFAWRSNRFFPACLLAACVTVYALNIAGLLPFRDVRHFLFLVPLTVVVLADGLWGALCAVELRRNLRVPLAALTLLGAAMLIAVSSLHVALHQERAQVSTLVATYRQQGRGEPLWVYPMAQPAVQLLAPDLKFVGLLPHRTSTEDWTRAIWSQEAQRRGDYEFEPAYADVFVNDVKPLGSVWLIFSHAGPEVSAILTRRAADLGFRCALKRTDVDTSLHRCVRSSRSG
jgi:hypothetical protein